MYTNVERAPLLQLHGVLRACFCKTSFIDAVSKTTLQLMKSSVLVICRYAAINHGRSRGKNYIQEMTLLSTAWWGHVDDPGLGAGLTSWCWSRPRSALLRGLMWLSSKESHFFHSNHKDWLLTISQASPTSLCSSLFDWEGRDTKAHTNGHSLDRFRLWGSFLIGRFAFRGVNYRDPEADDPPSDLWPEGL